MANWVKRILGGSRRSSIEQPGLFPNDRAEFYNEPYSFYEVLRRSHPFHRTEDGTWVLSRYRDIKEALDHPLLGNSPSRFSTLHRSKKDRYTCASMANNIMPFLDGPPHKEQRRLVARVFQKEVKAFTPRLNELATDAVDRLSNEFEVISDFAHPFAMEMICGIIGIPADERLQKWSGSFFYLFTKIPSAETRDEVDRHLDEFRSWVAGCLDEGPKHGVLSALATLIRQGGLDRQTAVDIIILLFADGLENVDSGIGNAILAFSDHPEEWTKLRGDNSLVPRAVAEVLRFDSPAQYIARTCIDDFEWHGHRFKKDANVILLLASANRDEEVFPDPSRLDISRDPNPHLSFGHGGHSCLGSRLVEMELAAILDALRGKAGTFQAVGPVKWQNRTGHRWMSEGHFTLASPS